MFGFPYRYELLIAETESPLNLRSKEWRTKPQKQ